MEGERERERERKDNLLITRVWKYLEKPLAQTSSRALQTILGTA